VLSDFAGGVSLEHQRQADWAKSWAAGREVFFSDRYNVLRPTHKEPAKASAALSGGNGFHAES
jgi:hypothetical protein